MKIIVAVLIGAFAWQEPLWVLALTVPSASCYMMAPEVGADFVPSFMSIIRRIF